MDKGPPKTCRHCGASLEGYDLQGDPVEIAAVGKDQCCSSCACLAWPVDQPARIEALIDGTNAMLDLGASVYFETYTGEALPRYLPVDEETGALIDRESGAPAVLLNRDNTPDRAAVQQIFDDQIVRDDDGSTVLADHRDDLLLALATGPKSGVVAIKIHASDYYTGVLDQFAIDHDEAPLIPTSRDDSHFYFFFKHPTGKTIPKNIEIKYLRDAVIELLSEGDMMLLPPTIGHWCDDNNWSLTTFDRIDTSVMPVIPEMQPWVQALFGIKDQDDPTNVVPEICGMPAAWVQEALEIKDYEDNHRTFFEDGEADAGAGEEPDDVSGDEAMDDQLVHEPDDKHNDKPNDEPKPRAKQIEPVDLWGSFDPPELPKDVLPKVIEDFAFIEGRNMGCDPAGLAMAALTVCAAAISDEVRLRVKKNDPNWTEAARLWTALIANVSGKKSPIISRTTSPLKKIDAELFKLYRHELKQYENLTKEEQAQREKPRPARVRLEDTTIEAAQEVFAGSPKGLLMIRDEISGWFGDMDRYAGHGGDRGFWLQSYNGGEYFVDRIKRGMIHIENLSASVLGGIQPDKIREIAADGIDDGLIQRLCPIIMRPGTKERDEVRDDINGKYNKLISDLYAIYQPTTENLKFSPAAQAVRNETVDKHFALESWADGVNKKFAAHIGKYNGIFGRLCVVFHCIDNMTLSDKFMPTVAPIVSEDTARHVAKFMQEFLLPHAYSFYCNTLALSDDHETLIRVAAFILTHKLKKIDRRILTRSVRSMRKMLEKDIKDIFDQLDAFGWITKYTDKNRNLAGVVNARVHELFEERAAVETARAELAREAMSVAFLKRGKEKKG